MISLFIAMFAASCVLRKQRERYPEARSFEPISVLKPLKGVDEGLYENLVALARQDYPNFEILCGAEDPDDPALEIARRVQREFPEVRIHVAARLTPEGLNPKVRLLRALSAVAHHEWILVSDSNVRPGPQYLREIRACQEATRADLVHNLLAGVGAKSVGARLENLHMNGWIASSIAFCDAGQNPCVIGKSMLFKKSSLEQVGGFAGVRDILAEDYILGERFTRAGFKVVLSPHVLPVVSGSRDLSVFWNRHVRWGQLRRWIAPTFFFGEIIVNPLPWFLAWAWLSEPPFQWFALACMAAKWALDIVLYARLAPDTALSTFVWIPLKDAAIPVIWLVSALRTRVTWRGHKMRIGPGSRLYPIVEPSAEKSEEALEEVVVPVHS